MLLQSTKFHTFVGTKGNMIRATLALVGVAVAGAFAPSSTRAYAPISELSMGYATGINGFGRIGRLVARILIEDPQTSLISINTGADAKYMAYQFKYDTIHGRWKGSLEVRIKWF